MLSCFTYLFTGLRWLLCSFLLFVFIWGLLFNWAIVFRAIYRKIFRVKGQKHLPSMVVFAGLFGGLGFYLCPVETLHEYFWIPVCVDPGTIPFLIFFGVLKSYQDKKEEVRTQKEEE